MPMRRLSIAFALAAATVPQPAVALDRDDWNAASRLGEVALVAAALGFPLAHGDGAGALQAGGSLGAAWLATEGLKQAFPSRRPDGSDRRSFPSGHTSISFAAAATLHQRNGWEVGLPATVAAAFVGVARIKADKHRWYDVLAGAAIGEAAGFLITSPRNANVRVLPWGDTQGGGVAVGLRF
ncbi:MAG TPA: phosphatase PAP2 family protein [Allosphingosinicella sp.]|nr:phosphatase PAP2 family protein [Allosphingosinicella sp.]